MSKRKDSEKYGVVRELAAKASLLLGQLNLIEQATLCQPVYRRDIAALGVLNNPFKACVFEFLTLGHDSFAYSFRRRLRFFGLLYDLIDGLALQKPSEHPLTHSNRLAGPAE